MHKSITYIGRPNRNPNDCWNDALHKAAERTYDQTRKDLETFIKPDGNLFPGDVVDTYLWSRGFKGYPIAERSTVGELMQQFDSVHNHIVFNLTYHTIYAYNNEVYDVGVYDTEKVQTIFIKEIL